MPETLYWAVYMYDLSWTLHNFEKQNPQSQVNCRTLPKVTQLVKCPQWGSRLMPNPVFLPHRTSSQSWAKAPCQGHGPHPSCERLVAFSWLVSGTQCNPRDCSSQGVHPCLSLCVAGQATGNRKTGICVCHTPISSWPIPAAWCRCSGWSLGLPRLAFWWPPWTTSCSN